MCSLDAITRFEGREDREASLCLHEDFFRMNQRDKNKEVKERHERIC